MTEQNNAAAERSAHVERGATRRIPGDSFLVETSPGVFQIKAVAEAIRERDEARAALLEARREGIEAAAKWHDERARKEHKIGSITGARAEEYAAAAIRALLEDGR